ncbi:hypothetical protein TREMEDRAFT_74579 [Tremella mesenterica DSM 1558]|uniref:uncharacterized protein n=1 Tax=Tremella mesenterica (strain ATCC 24925 / CBS 8224 / DSM 1558 / NBRC 9311 / NRRL Y-6157 / RJB 2259-6 / UBC 559-6) TaxID=578456 RepID=UPI0003F49B97|nr:uncharacterized protein TREMEDRAFT_74579 [Tremella mesenterica DSM 1558]EIW67432.1 hypothetical protein TREMEDRAFT_74579 [Tremella mesenterica DSM 1558]
MPPIDPEGKIPCPTPHNLQAELDALAAVLDLGEKEDTWEKMERAIIRFACVTRGGGYKHLTVFVDGLGRKGLGLKLAACMLSDRGRLSGVSTDLLQTLAPRLATAFAPLVTLYLEPLRQLLGRPNKVFLKRAEKCLATVISHCPLPSILPELFRGLADEAATCRRGCASGIERAMTEWDNDLFGGKSLTILEDAVKRMATDKDPEVRQIGKRVWALYTASWPDRADDFSAPLTPTVRRYLGIPAAGAGAIPSKAKIPPAARGPALNKSLPLGASASSVTAPLPASRPQPQRVQALAAKPIRTKQPATTNPDVQAHPPLVGPSRRPLDRRPEPVTSSSAPSIATLTHPARSTVEVTSSPTRADPLSFKSHGRSISHTILQQSASANTSPARDPASLVSYPLAGPARPPLVTSASCITLGSSSSPDVPLPPRRFAPPARILRPMPTEEEGYTETPDGMLITPSGATVLRNPQRPQQQERWVGLGKRPLGHAQRRVATAPGTVGDVVVVDVASMAKTPGLGNRVLSRREKALQEIEVDEGKMLIASPVRLAVEIPLPSSPLLVSTINLPPKTTNEVPSQQSDEVTLVASHPSPTTDADRVSAQNVDIASSTVTFPDTYFNKVIAIPPADSTIQNDPDLAVEQATHGGEAHVKTKPVEATLMPSADPPSLASSTSTKVSSKLAEVKSEPNRSAAPSKPQVSKTTHGTNTKTMTIERKTFKPTSQSSSKSTNPPPPPSRAAPVATLKPLSSKLSSSTSSTKPSLPTISSVQVIKSNQQQTSILKTSTSAPIKPLEKTRPPHSLTAPTKASQQRAAAATHRLPPSAVPKAPIPAKEVGERKEKIRLKAPLPSFRPQRGTAFSKTAGARSISSSTSGGVKPESVPLPSSPIVKSSELKTSPKTTFKSLSSSPLAKSVDLPSIPMIDQASPTAPLHIPLPLSPQDTTRQAHPIKSPLSRLTNPTLSGRRSLGHMGSIEQSIESVPSSLSRPRVRRESFPPPQVTNDVASFSSPQRHRIVDIDSPSASRRHIGNLTLSTGKIGLSLGGSPKGSPSLVDGSAANVSPSWKGRESIGQRLEMRKRISMGDGIVTRGMMGEHTGRVRVKVLSEIDREELDASGMSKEMDGDQDSMVAVDTPRVQIEDNQLVALSNGSEYKGVIASELLEAGVAQTPTQVIEAGESIEVKEKDLIEFSAPTRNHLANSEQHIAVSSPEEAISDSNSVIRSVSSQPDFDTDFEAYETNPVSPTEVTGIVNTNLLPLSPPAKLFHSDNLLLNEDIPIPIVKTEITFPMLKSDSTFPNKIIEGNHQTPIKVDAVGKGTTPRVVLMVRDANSLGPIGLNVGVERD